MYVMDYGAPVGWRLALKHPSESPASSQREICRRPSDIWDRGTREPIGDMDEGLAKGDLKFRLHGEKLKGDWVLVRMKATSTSCLYPRGFAPLRGGLCRNAFRSLGAIVAGDSHATVISFSYVGPRRPNAKGNSCRLNDDVNSTRSIWSSWRVLESSWLEIKDSRASKAMKSLRRACDGSSLRSL